MPKVIVNSTPLIVLCSIGYLEILKELYQGIVREVKPLLSELKRNGFYISSSVEKLVLEQAGE